MVTTVTELEACLGAPGLPAKLKAIDHIDTHAAQWIAAAPLMTLLVVDAAGALQATLGGDDPGFAEAHGANKLTIARAALDHPGTIEPGDGIAALFFAPGVTETLRVSGRVASTSATHITLDVAECFLHCGKALIRSAFWHPPAQSSPSEMPAAARFCVLGTSDADGNADVSPKGDPEGFLLQLDDKTIALPDRTGNRRADGHRNIIAHDRIALIAFAPGSTMVYDLSGRARLTRDAQTLARMTVEDKIPKLATLIAVDQARTYESKALRRARIWDADRANAPDRPNPAATFAAHIKLSQQRLKSATFEITPEGADKALAHDYKTNLY